MMIGQELAGFPVRHNVAKLLLWVRPDGGQARARRNAWGSMVSDRQRRSERILAGRDVPLKPVVQAHVP
jgi:hypothetical protein